MKEQIISIIRDIKNDQTIAEDAHLVFDGVLNSLEILQLITELEQHYSVKIPVEEVLPDNFDTIDGIEKMIVHLLA